MHFRTLVFVQCAGGIVPNLTRLPDVSYAPGNFQATYNPSGMTSHLTLTFAYSGMGDGTDASETKSSNVIGFGAALYAYSYEQGRCLFDTPFSMTDSAQMATDPPPLPYPITIQPVDTTNPKKPVVSLQVPAAAKLEPPPV